MRPEPKLPPGLDKDDYERGGRMADGFWQGYATIIERSGNKAPCTPLALVISMLARLGGGARAIGVSRELFCTWAQDAFDYAQAVADHEAKAEAASDA